MAEADIVVTVMEDDKRTELLVKPGDNLLLAMVKANLPVEFFCTTGKCTTCRLVMSVPDGSAEPISETEAYRLGADALSQGYRLACQLYVQGPLTVCLSK
ncbi:2Fe-2S iron-sulfur cluster-binding protein [Brevibacillus massiliensis]|jgi:ferredoxin|uniref:2Fe-2S iron-sulfur cluster-binding protein n=1 Tax=Brevibacillus massiliensis TaxID=1118054 RepID=UPI0002FBC308|nr:2Fe-2S iron-sulfur cluster-binding protein [Brevibacillus massiliensis]